MRSARQPFGFQRGLLRHPHARVRDEALHVIVGMRAPGAENAVIAALEDPDEKVRWRAANALPEFAPLSDESMEVLLGAIQAAGPENGQAAAGHHRRVAQLVRAIGAMNSYRDPGRIEQVLLEQARRISGHKRGFLQLFKKSQDPDQAALLQAFLATLATIGGPDSLAYLQKLAEAKDTLADAALKAADLIRHRLTA